MDESFVEKFLKGYADATSGKARLRTATYVSPTKLAERRFYWVATTEDGDVIEIDVPLPKNIISDAFSFFFLAAYNFLFIDEALKNAPVEPETAEMLGIVKDAAAQKMKLRFQGRVYLEYLFYLLWNQDDLDVRKAIDKCAQADDWSQFTTLYKYPKVHSYVAREINKFDWDYVDGLENLIPLVLDLYLYVNSLRKPEIRKIDEVGERAEGLARWL